MLASPLYAAPTPFTPQSDEGPKYARDIESFNKLLPPPVEFVEGSSSGALAVPEGKYEPINDTPKAGKPEVRRPRNASPPPPPAKSSGTDSKPAPLFNGTIDTAWPIKCDVASGLYNSGNTCFLNSALQCLFHTPPLLAMLIEHTEKQCRVKPGVFCMACNLRKVAYQAHGSRSAFSPSAVSSKLQVIAKHMRRGRQEDSHEFLRYAIDALQKSCLAGQPPKIDPLLAETTWVHKIFGGRLRSRVHCKDCGHNSDTFDSILDLSLDIYQMPSVLRAMRKFVAIDTLKGADKYKCEKCKKAVVAEKRFTVDEAPVVLTVHLKRFTPIGKKLTHPVEYEETLNLKPYMSEGKFGPSYSLYGVICHAGGGPNSGHYFAFVKSRSGRWFDMNDDSVSSTSVKAALNHRNAYILFYMRDKGQALDAAVNAASSGGPAKGVNAVPPAKGVVAGMKKRQAREDDDEDAGVKVTKPFIGPQLPTLTSKSDPQADRIRKKIAEASQSQVLDSLGAYASDNDDDEKDEPTKPPPPPATSSLPPSSPLPPTTPAAASTAAASSPVVNSITASSPAVVSATNFYSSNNSTKRKFSESFEAGGKDHDRAKKRSAATTPFSKGRMTQTYGRKKRPRPL
ncbi:Usp36 protein [Roridomyces roridus]|uniref:Ubiquitin carboxyl-terminal hydrolase n=1 Tax=Roridomyces roridus TaxID=1738132 RepID=A0AAD7C4V4_9AGAR|nr:Usp36 protein [Roridomyces roridus]